MNYIVLDTETTNSLDVPLVYDLGYIVISDERKVLEKRSFVIQEIFFDKHLMSFAYFAEKIPQYLKDIETKKREVTTLLKSCDILEADVKKHDVKAIIAHNAIFDFVSCNNTIRYLTKSAIRRFFPKDVEIWDSLKMAKQVFGNNRDYKDFCEKNGYLTSRGIPRMTAEVVYRFLSNDNGFSEHHTGLEDCLIEAVIFFYCRDKCSDKRLFSRKKMIEIFDGVNTNYVECSISNIIGVKYRYE